jgi:hypothetical protein
MEIIKLENMLTSKVLTGKNVEELEIIRRAIYIAGRQSLQARPANKDELREQFIKNGGSIDENSTLVFFAHLENIDGFTGKETIKYYAFSKDLIN